MNERDLTWINLVLSATTAMLMVIGIAMVLNRIAEVKVLLNNHVAHSISAEKDD